MFSRKYIVRKQRQHALRRAREPDRLGLWLTACDLDTLISDIQHNRPTVERVCSLKGTKSAWRTIIKDQPALFVYDSATKQVCTFFAQDWLPGAEEEHGEPNEHRMGDVQLESIGCENG